MRLIAEGINEDARSNLKKVNASIFPTHERFPGMLDHLAELRMSTLQIQTFVNNLKLEKLSLRFYPPTEIEGRLSEHLNCDTLTRLYMTHDQLPIRIRLLDHLPMLNVLGLARLRDCCVVGDDFCLRREDTAVNKRGDIERSNPRVIRVFLLCSGIGHLWTG